MAEPSAGPIDALRNSPEIARGLLEAAPDPIVVADDGGRIVLVNAQVEAVFGYTREELLGRPVEVLIPTRFRRHEGLRRDYFDTPRVRPMGEGLELAARHKDGSEFAVEVSLSPFKSGDRTFVSAAIRDVTKRQQIEEELREAKRSAERANRTKSQFLAAASHDLRQPLQAARLYLEVLARDQREPSELLGKLQLCLEDLRGLLNKLLDISKLESGSVVPSRKTIALRDPLLRIIDEFSGMAEEKGIELRVVCSDAEVETDPELFRRILGNLVVNAIHYTEKGGVLVGTRPRGRELVVQVWDTGPGIPPDQVEQIFEEFYQLDNPARDRRRGVGLGLAIVRRLGELLDHSVAVRSRVGCGSVFEVRLPRSHSRQREHAVENEEKSVPTGPSRIVVIEDDEDVLRALVLALEGPGRSVSPAASLDVALREIETQGERPTGVVSDYRLGGEYNGVDAILALRDRFGPMAAVLLTGDTSRSDLVARGAKESFSVLFKPVGPTEILAALGRDPVHPASAGGSSW